MSYSIMRQGDTDAYDIVQIQVDKLADIATLPITYTPGSAAICIEDTSVWMLSGDKPHQWVKLA